jgi:general secretion pathway protein K
MLFQHSNAKHYNQHLTRNHQQGVVIVVALFIVALVATIAYVMMARLERDTRRTMLLSRDTQAEMYSQGSVMWAMDQLRNDWEKRKANQPVDATPIKSPIKNEGSYQIASTIYDMQARYNLNNVTTPEAQADFKRMLKAVIPKISEQQAIQIAQALNDWISLNSQQNEFSKYYLQLPKPYRPGHQPMLSTSELRLVKGVTADIFNALKPYITALPPPTVINFHNASAEAMVTLNSSMTLEAAKMVEQLCRTAPPVSTQAFLNLDVVKNHHIASEKITVTSSYFLVETNVTIENQHNVLYTLLERTTNAQQASVRIVWQSKGI